MTGAGLLIGIILILLFVILFIDGGLLKLIVLIICFISIIRIAKSKRKPNIQIILIGITILIGWIAIEAIKQHSINTFYGGDERNHWQVFAKRSDNTQVLCKQALEKLSKQPLQIESVVIEENSVLAPSAIMALLLDRKLKFLEFKVHDEKIGQPYLLRTYYSHDKSWLVDQQVGKYVRVQLADLDNPNCISNNDLPKEIVEFLEIHKEKKCIVTTNIDSPSAHYALDFKAATTEDKYQPQGNYRLVDIKNNQVIEQLPTLDRGNFEGSYLFDITSNSDSTSLCRVPYTTIASLLTNSL